MRQITRNSWDRKPSTEETQAALKLVQDPWDRKPTTEETQAALKLTEQSTSSTKIFKENPKQPEIRKLDPIAAGDETEESENELIIDDTNELEVDEDIIRNDDTPKTGPKKRGRKPKKSPKSTKQSAKSITLSAKSKNK
jgi:hypothetical protein